MSQESLVPITYKGVYLDSRPCKRYFSLDTKVTPLTSPIAIYDPLHDKNLSPYFSRKNIQKTLVKNNCIDNEGVILNIEHNRSRVFIVEQEIKRAENNYIAKVREEQVLKWSIQKRNQLYHEQQKQFAKVEKIRHERELRRELLQLEKLAISNSTPKLIKAKAKSRLHAIPAHDT